MAGKHRSGNRRDRERQWWRIEEWKRFRKFCSDCVSLMHCLLGISREIEIKCLTAFQSCLSTGLTFLWMGLLAYLSSRAAWPSRVKWENQQAFSNLCPSSFPSSPLGTCPSSPDESPPWHLDLIPFLTSQEHYQFPPPFLAVSVGPSLLGYSPWPTNRQFTRNVGCAGPFWLPLFCTPLFSNVCQECCLHRLSLFHCLTSYLL